MRRLIASLIVGLALLAAIPASGMLASSPARTVLLADGGTQLGHG